MLLLVSFDEVVIINCDGYTDKKLEAINIFILRFYHLAFQHFYIQSSRFLILCFFKTLRFFNDVNYIISTFLGLTFFEGSIIAVISVLLRGRGLAADDDVNNSSLFSYSSKS